MSSKRKSSLKQILASCALVLAIPFVALFGIIKLLFGPKLNRKEANELFAREIEKLICLGKEELRKKIRLHVDQENENEPAYWSYKVTADSGVVYEIAFQGMLEGDGSDVTVYGSVSNAGPSVFHRHRELFTMKSDGSVVRVYRTPKST